MKNKIILLVLISLNVKLLSQTFNTEWQNRGYAYENGATSICTTTDGNYAVSYNNKFGVSKFDQNGNFLWSKKYNPSTFYDGQAEKIISTNDNGLMIIGSSKFSTDTSDNHGYTDGCIVKTDNDGNLIWKRSFGGSSWDYFHSIKPLSDGTYLVAGQTGSTDGDCFDNINNNTGWLINMDNNGNILWQKFLPDYNMVYSIETSNSGEIFVAGTDNFWSGDVIVQKLSKTGNLIWSKKYGGSFGDHPVDIFYNTTKNALVVCSQTSSRDGDLTNSGFHISGTYPYAEYDDSPDIWVFEINNNGTINWSRCYGGKKSESPTSIINYNNSYIISGGSCSSDGDIDDHHLPDTNDAFILQIDYNGNILNKKSFGGVQQDYAKEIIKSIDNKLIFVGEAQSSDGTLVDANGYGTIWLVKLNLQTLATNEIDIQNIEIFPNPFTETISFKNNSFDFENVKYINIFDCNGRFIKKMTLNKNNTINLSFLKSGIYFVELPNKDKRIIRKLIKI